MSDRIKGKLKFFSTVRGYGFITVGEIDYFLHASEIKDGDEFLAGDVLEFEIKQTSKGFEAINVTRIKEQ